MPHKYIQQQYLLFKTNGRICSLGKKSSSAAVLATSEKFIKLKASLVINYDKLNDYDYNDKVDVMGPLIMKVIL